MRERIARITDEYPWLVAEIDGQVAGYVYASRFRERVAYRWTAEVASYVSPAVQRRGLGRALYSTLISILRLQGFFKAIAGITVPNLPSIGLHESVGFTKAGVFPAVGHKDGQWLDVGWWELSLQPEISNPPDPKPIRLLRDSAAFISALKEGQKLANRRLSGTRAR
jgi:phosphinothricin acetyltransferase